jgi:CheY-like chemotaxis protein
VIWGEVVAPALGLVLLEFTSRNVFAESANPFFRGPILPMQSRNKFLVIDDNPDSRFLLVKTLLRKFPDAVVQECQSSLPAIDCAKSDGVSTIILHRASDADGELLIRLIRRVNSTVPIVMVSGYDRSQIALAAGANCFLNYDEWLRIGTVVGDLLGDVKAASVDVGTSAGSTPSVPTKMSL